MTKIRIKNFGPIKNGVSSKDGWIELKKVTIFIGNQGSGKSTVAKVISTLTWLEKAINRGDISQFLSFSEFQELFRYQRIYNYFEENTIIEYIGDKYSIKYDPTNQKFPDIFISDKNSYQVPKIMYVPAERNFLSTVENPYSIKNLPDTLRTFAEELRKGQLKLNNELITLPLSDTKFKYDKTKDISSIVGEDYNVNLLEASSGFQSFVPLFLVTKFLSDDLFNGNSQLSIEQNIRRNEEITLIALNSTLSEIEKAKKIEETKAKYVSTCLINIVEEPEQNLFPVSQHKMLNNLLEFNNTFTNNKLIMTTHSPYVINFLSIAIQANITKEKVIKSERMNLLDEIYKITPLKSMINKNDVIVYELEDKKGVIRKLSSKYGIPSDENYLNNSLEDGNILFDKLLEIEQEL